LKEFTCNKITRIRSRTYRRNKITLAYLDVKYAVLEAYHEVVLSDYMSNHCVGLATVGWVALY